MANSINWFEIPASNFDRAIQFYSSIMGADMPVQDVMGSQMAFFNATDGGVGGAVCHGEMYEPSSSGTIAYLNGGDDLGVALGKVEAAGGQVVMPKTKINDEVGHIAFFVDTEGNKVGIHSKN